MQKGYRDWYGTRQIDKSDEIEKETADLRSLEASVFHVDQTRWKVTVVQPSTPMRLVYFKQRGHPERAVTVD